MNNKLMWQPSKDQIEKSNMYAYMGFVKKTLGKDFVNYDELYRWSVEDLPDFWKSIWEFLDLKYSKTYDEVLVDGDKMPGAKWFVGARLNFTENLLRFRDEHVAIISAGNDSETRRVTYAELYTQVARLAKSMREMGVASGDRVGGFMPNIPETIFAMLAAASIGAIWSSCSPDFGIKGVLDRFGQIKPKLLFAVDGYHYNGKTFEILSRVQTIIQNLPSLKKVVVVPYANKTPILSHLPSAILYDDFSSNLPYPEIEFEQLPFEHPLYIMYSSGTTGLPKCIVQGAGGILINQLKELKLHTDICRDDKLFYFTTCGWMMWNWLVCSLSLGNTIMLFDGSPFYPDAGVLFKLAEDEGMTVLGTSAKYIAAIEGEGLSPRGKYNLTKLKAILSTGSPLSMESFDYVYRDIKDDIRLSSISGGTDLNGCFALGNPITPIYRGEIQCRGLGMKVEAFDDNGKSVIEEKGELACTAPFPSMPLYFWDDEMGKKYHDAYFDMYPGVWRHGDFILITKQGGVIIYGRSDATLNPGGVRIGTAEIYRQVEAIDAIADSLVLGQKWKDDERVILFVKMATGMKLTDEIKTLIKKTIKENASPRHVPAKIIEIGDIPYTINMKKVEIAVKKTINGEEVPNRDALVNPESLDLYKNLKELQED